MPSNGSGGGALSLAVTVRASHLRRSHRARGNSYAGGARLASAQLLTVGVVTAGSLRPLHHGRHGGEDRLYVAAGLEAEHGAAVVEEVEFHVAAAAHQLLLALRLAPGLAEIAPHELGVDLKEGAAHVLGEGEGGVPAAVRWGRREVVVEDAAHAAGLLAVGQKEVLLAPCLVAGVVRDLVRRARPLHGGMKARRIGVLLGAAGMQHGREIAAAAEPPLAGHDETRVH